MMDKSVIYGFVDEQGNHVNLDLGAVGGCPIQPVLNLSGAAPSDVQYFISRQQGDWFYHSMLDRNLAYADRFEALSLVPLEQKWLDSGNYRLVPALCD